MSSLFGTREECLYTKCYCEENVYKMCERVPINQHQNFFVAFISNSIRCVPLFAQKAAMVRPYVLWDYHVILLEEARNQENLVWDLDTLLEFPCGFDKYWEGTMQPKDWSIPSEYHRFFRVIPCAAFLESFSSDRSHMVAADGSWLAPPPSWDKLCKQGLHNIDDFISMDRNMLSDISQVFNENEMFLRFSSSNDTVCSPSKDLVVLEPDIQNR
ncbi:unnamed protein product [Cylicocyclus nassatus]|uniref:Protein N-terminal glutamine amidohydrolase n=1 Tax=Cylicocyclus nassatus TaxID=53992 RepID=A0AA36GLD8_CYLNA|nr:unnamed protein product [Cylicocyclus nassatus]